MSLDPLTLPWIEIAIATALVGALVVRQFKEPMKVYRVGVGFTGAVFVCTFLAWLAFYQKSEPAWSVQEYLYEKFFDKEQQSLEESEQPGHKKTELWLSLDELNAPLVPAVALLHFLMAVATAQTKMRRFSFTWSLAAEAIRVATFSSTDPWVLVVLLVASTAPPYFELVNRHRSTRVYVLHMAVFVALLLVGWTATSQPGPAPVWATFALMAAILIRCGALPAHCWLTDWFEQSSFGIALLYVTPLPGVYAAIRLVLPDAPDWVLRGIGLISLATAIYAGGMAVVQTQARRFFAYLFLSHASLVLVGLELLSDISMTGALCLWFSVIISLGGFGITLRALEARFGQLRLDEHLGLYEQTPALAICFLLTGLASVGFPGTLGFVSIELLVDGAVMANPYVGIGVVAAGALNGIAVVRAYFLLFTGARHVSSVKLNISRRERFAVLTLAALILGGGLYSQPGVASRQRAAEQILRARQETPAPTHTGNTSILPIRGRQSEKLLLD